MWILPSNDSTAAFKTVAAELRALRKETDRAVIMDGEIIGYWQTTEYIEFLLEMADECDQIATNEINETERTVIK